MLDSYRHYVLYLGRLGDTPLSAAWDLALLEYTNKNVYESRPKLIANKACAVCLFIGIFRYGERANKEQFVPSSVTDR